MFRFDCLPPNVGCNLKFRNISYDCYTLDTVNIWLLDAVSEVVCC